MRLIDADALKNKFSDVIQVPSFLYDGIVNIIDRAPTAYDVDKVIEGLKKNTFCAECYDEEARYDGEVFDNLLFLDDVNKIVKAGGVDEKDTI